MNRDIIILAKTLEAAAPSAGPELWRALCWVALNRLAYERELDPGATMMGVLTNPDFFPCWGDLRSMDFEPGPAAMDCAKQAGKTPDATLGARRFRKFFEPAPLWATGLKPAVEICGFLFYNNCD